MPKIFEYLGILIFFYSHEHEPIHVHARVGEYESKAEFLVKDGKISSIKVVRIGNRKPLQGKDLRNFNAFIRVYGHRIVEKWIEFFVLKKKVSFEKITQRLK